MAPVRAKKCALCSATTAHDGESLKRCSGCKDTWYCCEDHHKVGWPAHRKHCADLQNDTKPAGDWCDGCQELRGRDDPIDGRCLNCGYQACGSCACSYRRGNCYCPTSNFESLFCRMWPDHSGHLTGVKARQYQGPYHGDNDPSYERRYADEYRFDQATTCSSCGETHHMIRPERYWRICK